MKLHEDKELFRQAVEFTAQQMEIPAIYVEKDYWVTFALHAIFNHEIGKETVFKGGTALSKCFGLIDRFSEDIDLVVLRNEGETDSQMKSKIRKISKVVAAVLPEVKVDKITVKKGMNRKTAHTYSKVFSGNYGQVRDIIILESSWLGYYEPYTSKPISSYIYEMMMENGQEDIAVETNLLPFDVKVLEPTRTICEKIMSLVRFSHGEAPLDRLKRKIRHTYDLHQLLQNDDLRKFFDSADFDKMLIKVGNEDVVSFKNNNAWLEHHPGKAVLFADLDRIWPELKLTYTGDFSNLVYGKLPLENEIAKTLKLVKERLSSVEWTVKIENPK